MQAIINKFMAMLVTVLSFMGLFTASDYDKPIDPNNGGDPFIVESEGEYYYTYTTGGGVDIIKIADFDDATPIEKKTVFWCGESGTTGDMWAPEIHRIGDRWYIISCAVFDRNVVKPGAMPFRNEYEENNDYYRYAFVLESNTEDIFGEYTFKGILAPNGLNNIDGTYLKKDGKLYYVCSAYRDFGNQGLYIAEMENPYTLKKDCEAVEISYPKYLWEKRGWPVNEGPAVLYNGEDIHIVYSASGYYSNHYCMGMLTLEGDDVMDKDSWCKSSVPVSYHKPLRNIYNAGHCSFLYKEDGEIYMVYHANTTLKFHDSPRLTYVKKMEFEKGRPVF